ncbi:alpha/beta hydrolase [Reichenbachiella sp. MALMAid0571]|uniref:alpha/beta fold hydrolase n=1 Tax=Reichenbachiella sp. MALMAid0571 TaxID=3143939 RepID=UPI0032DE52CE
MHYNVSGSGIPIVLIHGFCETSSIWNDLAKELSEKYQVISIDLPGFGKSPLYNPDLSLGNVATLLHDFLKKLQITNCFMIGHSLGGYITLAFAEKYSEMLLGFGLFHSTTFADSEEKKETREKGIEHVEIHGMETFSKGFVPNLFYKANHSKFSDEMKTLKKIASETPIETFVAYSRAMKNRNDTTKLLSGFKKPIFIVAGENDNAVPLFQSQQMIAKTGEENSLILSETGHMGFIEKKEESFAFIQSFLTKNEI